MGEQFVHCREVVHSSERPLSEVPLYLWRHLKPIFVHNYILQTGETALHLASVRGHVDVVRLLVKAKADTNIVEKVQLKIYHC